MALDTRLIGQATGEGKPLELGQAVGRAVMRGEQAVLRTRAIEQRRKELQAQAIAQLPQLDESKVPMQMREWAIGQALEARNNALNAIRDKDMDPIARQMAISNAQQSIGKIAAKANDFKEWIAQFADTQPDDLSKLNSPELMERINDIYSGKFKVSGDQFVFEDGTVKDFNSLITTRHISRRSDAYMSQLRELGSEYEKYGLQGWDEKAFESKIDNELNSTKYTDADLASIAVDELGLPASEIKAIQDDFEDNGILDSVNKEALIAKIKDQYKTAARSAYDNARRLYKQKTAIQPPKPTAPTEGEIKRRLTSAAAQKYSLDISKFKNELGIAVNPAGIAIGDATNATLDIESPNFSNLANKLGFRISSIYRKDPEDKDSDIQSIELKQQGGNKTFEVVPGQNTISFLEQAFLMQGVNRLEVPQLINNVLYGTFIPPSQEINTDYEN